MESHYDLNAWATETTLGRHIFNSHYRMTGAELRGWELLSSTVMSNEKSLAETVYMWQKKNSDGHQLVRISIAELNDWRRAQAQLHNELLHCMRANIPRGKKKLAATGDINFVGKEPSSNVVSNILFTRGNLSVSVRSVGDQAVDVTKMAQTMDTLFHEPPNQNEIEKGHAEELSPKTLQVEENVSVAVEEKIAIPVARGGWLKIIAQDGELKREDDTLFYISTKPGRKRIGKYLVTQ